MDHLSGIPKHTKSTSTSEGTGGSTGRDCGRIYRTSTNGSQCRKEKDFDRGKSEEVRGWEVFILWWV